MRPVVVLPLLLGLLTLPAPAVATPSSAVVEESRRARDEPAGAQRIVYGRSVQGRPLEVFRLGDPDARRRVLLFSTMHGDEPRTQVLLRSVVRRAPVAGVDLWVVPVYNPDGLVAGTRHNARGVDLNRNFPFRWADLDGRYESGPRPASEPETRAAMRLVRRVEPDRVLSFHQPLDGVDTDRATSDVRYARRVARVLRMPLKRFACGGVCRGTMTGWLNRRVDVSAVTVEYGAAPSTRLLTRVAPRRLLRLVGARTSQTRAEPFPR